LKTQEVLIHTFVYRPEVPVVTSVSINIHPFAYQVVVSVGTVVPCAINMSFATSLKTMYSPAVAVFWIGVAIVS
jgi:hypothetical protein